MKITRKIIQWADELKALFHEEELTCFFCGAKVDEDCKDTSHD